MRAAACGASSRSRFSRPRPRVPALDRLELCPEQVALELERLDRTRLLFPRSAALDDEIQRVLRVAWRLLQPLAEVLEPGGVKPRVVPLERLEPYADCSGPAKLGERG